MLFPRFTIRTLLIVTTLCAVFSLVVGAGVRGHNWGWGITIAVLSLAVAALVHASCFGLVWLFALWSDRTPSTAGFREPVTEGGTATNRDTEESA